jgi:hypothetical protein
MLAEKDIFTEKQVIKSAEFACPFCRSRNIYEVRWLRRTRKSKPPAGISEQDRLRFEKSRDYLVRIDDQLRCKNPRCKKSFDIPNSQSVVFI